jgi:hypothetical protein
MREVAVKRRQRAEATRRWRERLDRGAAVYSVEADAEIFDLMIRLGLLDPADATSRRQVATALGALLRRALNSLKREIACPNNSP